MSTPNPSAHATIRLTMAQAVVKYLQVQHSERDGSRRRLVPAMFGIFGHGNVAGMGQALFEYGHSLPYYQPRNEQSMVHTAMGFAKASHRLSTLACTASVGPGSTNMLTGAATATINRIPVLLLPSDYYATRRQGPVLQQLEHPVSADLSVNDCFRPVSRFFDRISRPEQLLTALPEAMRVLTDPAETGAVTISLPQDIQAEAYDYPAHFFGERVWRIERRLPHPQRIEEAAALLRDARRPVIIAGGGVLYSQASTELQAFSESFGIPVGETLAGKGAVARPSPLLLGGFGVTGNPAAGRIVAEADLVICIGTRLTDFSTGSLSAFAHPDVRFIHINVAGHDAYKLGALPVLADARDALRALHAAAAAAGIQPDPNYLRDIAAARAEWQSQLRSHAAAPAAGEIMNQGVLIDVVNAEAQPGDTIVAAAGSPPGDLHEMWDATGERRCHIEFGNSCMGYEIPAGIGIRMTQPQGEVFVLIGDGTYCMNPMELITACMEKLKITVIVSENHGFQIIRRLQMARAGRSFGNEFRQRDDSNRLEGEYQQIDFTKNAESMGARVWHVFTPEDLRSAIREARAETRPCVVVVETQKFNFLPSGGVWWDVAPSEVTNDGVTQELRAAYEEERQRLQRFYY
jgi:3D-(3,5/4)-trihydroxycyclohexane-1,2-dione acylhydrolase (decyclizing)